MGRALIINNADFSANAVERVTFAQGMYIEVGANIEEASSLISGGGFYAVGQTATITATSSSLLRFVKWSDGNTNSTRTVVITNEGTLVLTAEYEYTISPNDFIWGNGGITTVKNTSGSVNNAAGTKTKMIHALTDLILKINPGQEAAVRITAYGIANTNPETGATWTNVGTFTNYASQTPSSWPKTITIPSGKYAQVCVGNMSSSYRYTDLTILSTILLLDGEYELV